jgi:YggT family protein
VNGIICILLTLYWAILLVRILASWFPVPMSGPLRTVLDIVYDLTEPVMRPLRSVIPPVRLGAFAMDISPILIFVVIAVLRSVFC